MQIYIIAVGQRMPAWVQQGVEEYLKRMPPHCRVQVREVAAVHRGKNADVGRILKSEGESLIKAVPKGCRVIALDRTGKQFDTPALAGYLTEWMADGNDVALLIGGPEGLPNEVLQQSDSVWSLSALTFAHPLVRVVLAEQLYRAWAITENHPYHK
ncbi:MAG: 23S rRNA (pseudouridine(1915)-N(3))-methyltransferase RlmH [Acidiferrobacterales bacterium]